MVPDSRRRRRSRLRTLAAAAALAAAVALAGCGGGDEPATATARPVKYSYARDLFREVCAGCHRLADAGASGSVDLDSLPPDAETRRQLVSTTIRLGGDGMPAFNYTFNDTELKALTQYVVAVAGRSKRSGDGSRATILTPMDDPQNPPNDPIAYGRALFKQICAGCHTLADAGAHGKRYDLDYNYGPISEHEKRIRVHRGVRGFPPFMPNWERFLPGEWIEALERYIVARAGRPS